MNAQDLLVSHARTYREAAAAQHEQATRALAAAPPDYSSAATACHRALQFTRQAEALGTAARELLAMHLTGELSL